MYEGLSSFREATDALQGICAHPGIDLDAQIESFSGTTTMKDLLEMARALGQSLDQLLEGNAKFPDDQVAIQITSLADFAFKLDGVTQGMKDARSGQHLSPARF